jgi:hypothetical protein
MAGITIEKAKIENESENQQHNNAAGAAKAASAMARITRGMARRRGWRRRGINGAQRQRRRWRQNQRRGKKWRSNGSAKKHRKYGVISNGESVEKWRKMTAKIINGGWRHQAAQWLAAINGENERRHLA